MSPTAADEPVLTDEQRRPLEIRGASVALSSGAGCGKTTVLTARFLGALDGGSRPLRSLVALTFTEKAASELRKRVRDECHRRLAASDGDDAVFWRSVLRGLAAAPIGTFHEFCAGLLRRNALRAGLDPEFTVLDEAIAESLLDDALARCLRRWLAEQAPDLIELAVDYGLRPVRDALAALIRGRVPSQLTTWAERTEAELIAEWQAVWDDDGREALIAPVVRAAGEAIAWLEANAFENAKLKAFRSVLLELLDQVHPRCDLDWLRNVRESAYLPRGLRAEHWPSPEVNGTTKKLMEAIRKTINTYCERCSFNESITLRCAGHGLRYARLAAEARSAYDRAKAEHGGLDFDDLLVKTRDLLLGGSVDPGRAVEFVMVDEFQDTDPVQSEILRGLGGDGFDRGGLFVVGDFKQSIYRFRGAEPGLFRDYRAAFPEAGRLDLRQNFRSAEGVIDFVNALFASAFVGETPRLEPGPHSAPAGDGPAVEFVWADEPADDGPAGGKKPSAAERRRVEARWLARLIRARLDAGWPVRDRNSKQVRAADAGDVAFLFRAMTDLAPYEQALEAEGLDFHVVGGRAFYAQQEVQDVVNVLSVIEDPLDAVALAGALRSPFFGVSDEGLFWLGRPGRGTLAEGLWRSESVEGLSDLDRRRAVRARDLLATWRGLKDRVGIADLVDRVLDESGFEAALLGERLGDRKRANARKLVRLARRFDARGGFSLGHYVARLRADLRRPPREEQAATTDEEGPFVRLMSVHQSKGLEFPIVVLPDLNRKSDGGRRSVALHPKLGPVVRPARNAATAGAEGTEDDEGGSGGSLGWVTYEAIERREDEAEALRLFYVAATRARESLVLSAGVAADARPDSPALRLLAERFDRRMGSCLARLPDGWRVPAVRVTIECPPPSPGLRSRPKRPRLPAVARLIESARVREPESRTAPPPRPRLVDLDPALTLPPRAARLARLIRTILADPRALPGKSVLLADVARLAARRQEPRAQADLVDEATKLLRQWLGGSLGERLARAGAVKRNVAWNVVAPTDAVAPSGSTVFLGRAEFYTRESPGAWTAYVFSPPGASDTAERLRLLLSARAAEALGMGPVVQAWRVRLDGGGVSGEDKFGDDVVVEAAVAATLDLARPTGS
jgi:ATP-dependent helicase/nuclease subunit A